MHRPGGIAILARLDRDQLRTARDGQILRGHKVLPERGHHEHAYRPAPIDEEVFDLRNRVARFAGKLHLEAAPDRLEVDVFLLLPDEPDLRIKDIDLGGIEDL